MKLDKIFLIILPLFYLGLLGLLIINSEFLFIEDHNFWINVVVINIFFGAVTFIAGLIIVSTYRRRVNKHINRINDLKGKLYDTIKDDEARDKIMKAFEKSIK